MLTGGPRQPGRGLLGWIGAASLAVAIAAWVVLVLDHQYQVRWFGDYAPVADALFLAGVAGIVVTMSLERWGAGRMRLLAVRLAFSLAVLAGALVAAEFAARFVFRDALSIDPHISLNSLGFREREVRPKEPGRYRIVIIGDSFTFGNGIEEPDRFSNVLQGFLGPRYEVLNLGHPGYNLPEHLSALDVALTMSPDFVLLQLYENDFETPRMIGRRPRDYPLLPSDLDRRIAQTSVIYRLLIDRWNLFQEAIGLAEGYPRYMARHLRDPDSPDAHDGSITLMQFIDRARAAGVPSGGVLFPAIYGLAPDGANYPFDYLNDRVKKIYNDEQRPYLDLLPAFLTVRDPRSLAVSPWDAHPNAKANHLAAIAILNKFLPEWEH